MSKYLRTDEIAKFLNKNLHGKVFSIETYSDIKDIKANSVIYLNKNNVDILNKINKYENVLVICNAAISEMLKTSHIVVENPRVSFIEVIREFFSNPNVQKISNSAIIQSDLVGKNLSIGEYSVIEKGAKIGDNVTIGHHVVIRDCVEIGDDVIIKSGAVIGEMGFGFDYNEYNKPIHFPHIGKVKVGNNVLIGANTTVERGTILDTIISDDVKIDDLVQIGHNSVIGESTLIMVGALILGGVKIGKKCWIAPNTTIREKIIMEDESSTGIGSVVVKNVNVGELVYGVPAKTKKESENKGV